MSDSPADAAVGVPAAAAEGAGAPPPPTGYVILASIAKKSNIGPLIRTAVGLGFEVVVIASRRKHLSTFGAKGAELHARFHFFHTLKAAAAHLKAAGVAVIGIEITPDARPVQTFPFPARGAPPGTPGSAGVAFLPGHETLGLNDDAKALCDSFVYVPQFGNGTASLNVHVATSICLFHYALHAGWSELGRNPNADKFELAPVSRKSAPDEMDAELRAARAAAQAETDAAIDGGISLAGLGGGAGGDDDDF